MKAKIYFITGVFLLILTSFSYTSKSKNDPILTRHDKGETEFLKLAERFEKYMCHLNLPDCEGTVIADQWALTAAHCAVGIAEKLKNGKKHFVIVNSVEIEVDKVIMYKEWEDTSKLNDMSPLNDIALLHLKTKPISAKQAKLYTEKDEVDKIVYMVGRGDKGNGINGVRTTDWQQRGATNRIETANGKWLSWTFDHPDTKTKYLTEFEGISSWQDTKDGPEGLYGVVENYTRVSHYINWIHNEMRDNRNTSKAMLRIKQKPNAIDTRPKAIHISPNTLKKYVGEYTVQGTTIKIYLNKEGTKLYSFVAGQMPYELVPTAKNVFSFKVLEGFKLEYPLCIMI